jgi:hypothetical protein
MYLDNLSRYVKDAMNLVYICPLKSELLWVLLTPRARPVLLELMAHSEVHERRGGVKLYVNYLLFLMT